MSARVDRFVELAPGIQGIEVGLVHIVADIQPKEMPGFLPVREPDPFRYFIVR
jgi:hypothetical protein